MIKKKITPVIHKTPADLHKAVSSNKAINEVWKDITPLARNEWACWVLDAKKPETRIRRISRAKEDLAKGKRRPCCWIGCIHRTDKPISPSVQGILNNRNKKLKSVK